MSVEIISANNRRSIIVLVCDIWRAHGSDYECYCLTKCDAV